MLKLDFDFVKLNQIIDHQRRINSRSFPKMPIESIQFQRRTQEDSRLDQSGFHLDSQLVNRELKLVTLVE